MLVKPHQLRRRKSERGSVTIMTSVLMVGLVLVIGLSIDVARIYMVRSGLQNAADAAALAAARELNGQLGGLTDAVARATDVALQVNKSGINRTGANAANVTIASVEFSTSLESNATWYNTPGAVPVGTLPTIRYVRVTTQTTSVSILFAARALGSTYVEQRNAVAGMSVGLNTVCNFFPIGVSLTNAYPANHTQLTFTFTDISGTSATLVNNGYVVLEIPEITGNGLPETANLAAGTTRMTATIGGTLEATPSANDSGNGNGGGNGGGPGPKAIAAGANTRFNIYQSGYSNDLNPTNYPPDTNIAEGLTSTQYLNKSPFTAPSNPGKDDRRVLFMPIFPTGVYDTAHIPTTRFGAFLLRSIVPSNGSNAGNFSVEYLGDDFPIGCGYFDPSVPAPVGGGGGGLSLTKPVLYR